VVAESRWLGYQAGLDGLRGLAIAAVVAFHLGFDEVSGGYLGVSLFFTLSGFLIGTLILNEIVTTGRFSLARFWRRRARRLLPPAVITLAIVATGRVVMAHLEATAPGDIIAGVLDVANWHFVTQDASYDDLFNGPSAVLHFWSLAIEEQFYLVVGVLAVLVARHSRRPVRTVFVAAAATAAASFLVPIVINADVDRIYYGTDTRAGEVMVGVAASAVLVSARRRTIVVGRTRLIAAGATFALLMTLFLWLVATPGTDSLRRGLLPLTAGLSLLLVLGALTPTGPVSAITRARPIVWLGGISYALYLVHWPVIVIADHMTDSRSLARSATIVAISLGLAQLSAVVVEHPVRRHQASVRPLAFAGMAMVAVVGFAVVIQARATSSATLLGGLAAADAGEAMTPSGDNSTSPRIAVFGDSVGFSLLLALGDTTVTPHFERAPSDVSLGCGIALSPSPPADPPGACDDPAQRFAAKAAGQDLSAAVMISCQWELLAQPLPGRGDDHYAIGSVAFDSYVRMRYANVANQLTAAGVDRILWMTCPYLSSSVGVDGLSPRFRDSREPARVDHLNTIITSLADERADVDVLPFSDWVNQHVDDGVIRPDGSHYEHRGHNPAADAFVHYLNAALKASVSASTDIGGRVR
jgi:peptidoglycan/LPS O-acetylase OafA/YrhL